MKHLDDIQLVNAMDGALDPGAAAHLVDCVSCAARVSELRATLIQVARDAVAEPSPLFWTHFGERVSAAIDAQPAPVSRWLVAPRLAWVALAALLVAAGFVFFDAGGSPHGLPAPVAEDTSAASVDVSSEEDEAWAVVQSLAEEADYDEVRAAGILPPPGSVERVASEMTDAERHELARLIEAELKRTGP